MLLPRQKIQANGELSHIFFGKKGSPIFQNSSAFFECRKHKIIKLGDHHVVIGEVLDFGKINDEKPLVYYAGKYAEIER